MKSYMEWVIRYRFAVIAITLMVTMFAVFQAKNLKIIIDPNTMLPQTHPYVSTSTEVEKVFGLKNLVVIGITPKQGDLYQATVLQKVQNITAALLKTSGVMTENMLSLSAPRAKNIIGTDEGMEVKQLMLSVPNTAAQMQALRVAVNKNSVYLNAIVSKDEKTAAIVAQFKDAPGGFREIQELVDIIVERERDDSVEINVSGLPSFLSHIEIYSERMGFLLPIAILVLGLVLFGAFRTRQGMFLPLATGILAVAWGLGVMGAFGIPMDVFNATTPILIMAVATGHAVQMLKRYYEEYYLLRATSTLSARQANDQAVINSLLKVGPVMITAGAVASLGFFSLVVFEISTIRTFGIFTGVGILATMVLEMTFIPALRSVLAPPNDAESQREHKGQALDKVTHLFADLITGPKRKRLYLGFAALIVIALVGMSQVQVNNSLKSYFSPDLKFVQEDGALNDRLGGTNFLSLLIEGKNDDAIKNPQTLKAMDDLQHFLDQQPHVGKTMSIADFIKRMNQAMHSDAPAFYTIPEDQNLISQYLLMYSLSGEPSDFDSYVDYGYRMANISVLLKTDSTAYTEELIAKIQVFAAANFPGDVQVRFGGLSGAVALNEVMVHGKILNILQIAAVVFLIASLVFRSLVAGMLVLMPLLIAVLVNFGLMGWTGMTMNISTSLTSAMAVGIGADYAIYLIFRLREELATGIDENTAVRNVMTTAGKAVLFVAIAVAAGYGVLLTSFGFNIHKWLAILIGTAMIVSAISALLLIPALILTFRPNFIFRRIVMKNNPLPAVSAAVLSLVLTFGLTMQPKNASAAELDLTPIMEKNFMVSKVQDSIFDATFTLTNKSGQERVRKTFGITKLQANGIDNMRMTRFMSPPDVRGTVSMLIEHADKDDDIWIYLPALKKVRRLVASNKKDSFAGTDFSNADVIGYKVSEWNYTLLKEEALDGLACYVVESTPKNEEVKNNTGYSKLITWIRKDNLMSVKSESFDGAGDMLKTMTFSDVQLVDAKRGKWQAMRLEANNIQTGHRTVIKFENFKVNQQVKDEFFTTRYMEKE